MENIYKTLIKILSLKPEQLQSYRYQFEGQQQIHLQKILLASSLKQNSQDTSQTINKFISYMSQQRSCRLTQEYFKQFEDIKFMACHQRKVYNFDPQLRAYCIYGRAISLIKRKSKDVETQRYNIVSQVQRVLFSLNQQNLLSLSKNQSHQIDDIIMNYDNYQENYDPIYLSNQVYSPFMPHTYALVMVLPFNYPKPEQLINFLKSSLLHIYADQANVLSKVMFRETFYKNSIIRGIYFIQQGEVQSTGGRIVARGWVSNGRCKSVGYGWKFKPVPFLKTLAKNQHLWKQFTNDLMLNSEYPLKINYILGLDDQMNFQIAQKKGHKKFFLPKIGHGSFDYGKLTQIQKVKHYDDRINELCDYKQKILKRKAGSSLYKPLGRMVNSIEQRNNKRILLKNSSSSRSRYNNSLTSSSQNILIMSVLKKLENLTEQSNSNQQQSKQRRDKIKISPAHLYEKSRIMKKKRYNQ